MKKLIILLAYIVLSAMVFISCNKEDDNNNNTDIKEENIKEENTDEYYVRYYFPVYSSNVQYRDVDNELKGYTKHGKALDITIGPVKKGFEAYLTGANGLNPSYYPTMKIEVSKNNSVLSTKAFHDFSDANVSYTLTYVIDY